MKNHLMQKIIVVPMCKQHSKQSGELPSQGKERQIKGRIQIVILPPSTDLRQ